jgi:hypothetical protein
MATPEPYNTLDANPWQRFAEFERKVYDDAGSSCIDLLPHGLLALVVSDTVWASLPNNTTVDDNVTTTIHRQSSQPTTLPQACGKHLKPVVNISTRTTPLPLIH